MVRRLVTGVAGVAVLAALPAPATADAPAHGTFVHHINNKGVVTSECVEAAASGTRDCAYVSFAVREAQPWVYSSDGSCGANLPAALTVWTEAFGGHEVVLHGVLQVYRGAGTFVGQSDPAHNGGIVASGELAYAGPACAATGMPAETLLAGSFDVVTMIPI